jgi:hypothetical protein
VGFDPTSCPHLRRPKQVAAVSKTSACPCIACLGQSPQPRRSVSDAYGPASHGRSADPPGGIRQRTSA